MRYIKYITALFAFFAVVASCIDEDVVRLSGGNGNCIQLVGRVMPFTDVEVDTRSPKNDPKEYAANTMDLMILVATTNVYLLLIKGVAKMSLLSTEVMTIMMVVLKTSIRIFLTLVEFMLSPISRRCIPRRQKKGKNSKNIGREKRLTNLILLLLK